MVNLWEVIAFDTEDALMHTYWCQPGNWLNLINSSAVTDKPETSDIATFMSLPIQ